MKVRTVTVNYLDFDNSASVRTHRNISLSSVNEAGTVFSLLAKDGSVEMYPISRVLYVHCGAEQDWKPAL